MFREQRERLSLLFTRLRLNLVWYANAFLMVNAHDLRSVFFLPTPPEIILWSSYSSTMRPQILLFFSRAEEMSQGEDKPPQAHRMKMGEHWELKKHKKFRLRILQRR